MTLQKSDYVKSTQVTITKPSIQSQMEMICIARRQYVFYGPRDSEITQFEVM